MLPSDPTWLHFNTLYVQEFMFALTETRFERGPVIGQRNVASIHVWSDAEWQRAGSCCAHEGADCRLEANLWLDLWMQDYGRFLHKTPDKYLHCTMSETELISGLIVINVRYFHVCWAISHINEMFWIVFSDKKTTLSTLGSGLHDLPRDNVYSSCQFNLCVFLFCGPYCRFSVEIFLDCLMIGIIVFLGRKKVRWVNWHSQVIYINKNTQRHGQNIQAANGKATVCPKWQHFCSLG